MAPNMINLPAMQWHLRLAAETDCPPHRAGSTSGQRRHRPATRPSPTTPPPTAIKHRRPPALTRMPASADVSLTIKQIDLRGDNCNAIYERKKRAGLRTRRCKRYCTHKRRQPGHATVTRCLNTDAVQQGTNSTDRASRMPQSIGQPAPTPPSSGELNDPPTAH